MNIITTKIKASLESIRHVLPSRPLLPIASCFRLSAVNNTLTIRATDCDQEQVERVECDGSLADCCINAQALLNAIGGETMIWTLDGNILEISFAGNVVKLNTLAAEEFPAEMNDKFSNYGVSCPDLEAGIKAVAWVAPRSRPDRPMFECVHIVSEAKLLHVEAANGAQLASCDIPAISAKFEALFHGSMAVNIRRGLLREGCVLSLGERLIRLNHAAGSYTCKLSDLGYANTDRIYKTARTEVGRASTLELGGVFDRCHNFSEPANPAAATIEFDMAGGRVTFTGKDNAGLNLNFAGTFKPHTARVNAVTFRSCLLAVASDEIKIFAAENCLVLVDGNLTIITAELRDK